MEQPQVILVDKKDNAIGTMEKLEAHEKGVLHRAFSVFLFNDQGEMLLQRRALTKYHTPGLWTNTCCSHPLPGEETDQAALRRLVEEMGISNISIDKAFDFIYYKSFPNGLIEHEFDHVYTGKFNGTPVINPDEVHEFKWMQPKKIQEWINQEPEAFTYWFLEAFNRVLIAETV